MEDINFVWKQVRVELDKDSYDILIGPGVLTHVSTDLKDIFPASSYFIISDSNVSDILGEDLLNILKSDGLNAHLLSFPAGEASKNMDTVVSLARNMVRKGADRKSMILALGGGVTGDIAAFLASIYMRGIKCIQLPTSLLAQVDSSVGGKTGVDIPEGKNLLGTFFQPKRVYCDIGTLTSLPRDEFINGMAEVVKYGMIMSKELFNILEKNYLEILNLEPDLICKIVTESCSIKAKVVSQDEREGGLRRILNFGHTIGHSIEAASDYAISHGRAVSIGMVVVSKLALIKGMFSEREFKRLKTLLNNLGLPTCVPSDLDTRTLIELLYHDKKTIAGRINFVLCSEIGRCFVTDEVDVKEVEEAIDSCR